jgi:ankyrin repeat protein
VAELTSLVLVLGICLSSRHYPHIETKGRNIILEDEAGHKEDIEQYIKKKLRLPTSKDAQSLRSDLLEASRMIFLWAVLVVDILNRDHPSKSIKQMGRRLREIPKELGDLFEMILQRDGENPEALQLCLKWILFAERPMKLQVLYFAVQFGLDEEEGCSGTWDRDDLSLDAMKASVKEWSKGLSEIKGKASVVQFIHESVRDFLLGRYKHRWDEAPENIEGRGHEILKNCCLAQMEAAVAQSVHMPHVPMEPSIKADQYRETIRSKFPFLKYSILKVLHHANSAQSYGLDQGGFLGQFPLECWKALNNLFEKVNGRKYGAEVNLLYLLAERNLVNLVKFFPQDRSYFYPETGICPSPRYGPPLFAALAHESNETARVFLEAEVKGKPSESRIRGLLEDRKRELGSFDTRFRFSKKKGPLLHVAEEGYSILLESLLNTAFGDVDVNCRDPSSGRSPLSHVARRGLLDMAALLLEKGADVAQMDREGRAPLSYAAEMGHLDMVALLLEKGADIEQRDKDGRGPLSYAMGHPDMVTLLLEKGANIAGTDRHGRTPVSYAAEFGDPDTVAVLVEQGADIEQKDMYGRSPILYAAERGYLSTATLLLFRSGHVFDSKDESGHTFLDYAALSDHGPLFMILLQMGADIEHRDKDGRTHLSLAAAGFETQTVVKMLCVSGAQIDTKDRQGRTPLSWAAGAARNASVEILCANGAQVDSKDVHGRTPLSWAAEMGNCGTIRLLRERGAQIDAQDEQGRTPLSWAAQAWRVSAVYFLLNMGADSGLEDNQGHTPLWYATQGSNTEVIRLLRWCLP